MTDPENAPAQAGRASALSKPVLRVSRRLVKETFAQFRRCGEGRNECQVLWIGPWNVPDLVTEIIHPMHQPHFDGFVLDDAWITSFWVTLAERGYGIRAQVHTHPRRAFHSATDDAWPIVHLEGFLSLVIPDFAMGRVSLERSYLAELASDGQFYSSDPNTRISLV